MVRSRIRAARPLRGRALRMNRAGPWNPIETRKALFIRVANQRFTTLATWEWFRAGLRQPFGGHALQLDAVYEGGFGLGYAELEFDLALCRHPPKSTSAAYPCALDTQTRLGPRGLDVGAPAAGREPHALSHRVVTADAYAQAAAFGLDGRCGVRPGEEIAGKRDSRRT